MEVANTFLGKLDAKFRDGCQFEDGLTLGMLESTLHGLRIPYTRTLYLRQETRALGLGPPLPTLRLVAGTRANFSGLPPERARYDYRVSLRTF